MPSVWEVFDTIVGGVIVLFVIGGLIIIFSFIIGGYFAPFFKELYGEENLVLGWVKDMPDRVWQTYLIISAIVILGFFAYIFFKMNYEREYGAIGGGY